MANATFQASVAAAENNPAITTSRPNPSVRLKSVPAATTPARRVR